jgi:hypothetical protein
MDFRQLLAVIEDKDLLHAIGWGGVVAVFGWVWKLSGTIKALEIKVETLWEQFMRTGLARAAEGGFMTRNSPFRISDVALNVFGYQFVVDLREWRRSKGPMNQQEIELGISRAFGRRIFEDISITKKLDYAACLRTAIEIATAELTDSQRLRLEGQAPPEQPPFNKPPTGPTPVWKPPEEPPK